MDPEARETWDAEADTFDEAWDHGLLDPTAGQAWSTLLAAVVLPRGGR